MPEHAEGAERDAVNTEHQQGHVAAERINDVHTGMTREQVGWRHGEYSQAATEGCYICSLLTRVRELEGQVDALEHEWRYARERGDIEVHRRTDAESRISSLLTEREELRETLAKVRTYADARDGQLDDVEASLTALLARDFALEQDFSDQRHWSQHPDSNYDSRYWFERGVLSVQEAAAGILPDALARSVLSSRETTDSPEVDTEASRCTFPGIRPDTRCTLYAGHDGPHHTTWHSTDSGKDTNG